MADVFDLYVKDNRTIQFNLTEPIMLEDSHVSDWVFHIPRVLNNIDMSGWAWWLVYINARGQKYSELLELSEDPESPLEKCIATYSVDYGMSIRAGVVRFSLEAINADTQGTILNEWHTQTYQAKVQDTLQGNQVEYAETESDIISALIVEVQNKVSQLVGGATPEPVSLIADMTDTKKVYLYVGSETGESTNYWYYYNGSAWVAGGLYAGGITVDSTPTQGSSNAVSSGGVYSALQVVEAEIPTIDSTLSRSGQAADAKVVGDRFTKLRDDLNNYDKYVVGFPDLSGDATKTIGAYIDDSGVVTAQQNFYYTSLIPVEAGDYILYVIGGDSSNPLRIHGYIDGVWDSMILKQTVGGSQSGLQQIQFTVPSGVNGIKMSSRINKVIEAILPFDYQDIITVLDQKQNRVAKTVLNFGNPINGYIKPDGTVTAQGNWKHIAVENVRKGSVITLTSYCSDALYAIMLVDSGGTFVGGVKPATSGSATRTYTTPQDGTVYLNFSTSYAVSGGISYTYDLDALADRVTDVEEDVKIPYLTMLHKIGVLGDSLSSGEIYDGSTHRDCYTYSWLSNICRDIGADAVHYSKGGLTTKAWWSDTGGYKTALATESEKPSAYYIAFGTNDKNQSEYGIGTIADIAGTDSFVGYMRSIIEYVHTEQPNAVIYLVTTYNDSVASTPYNEMIEAIADLYSYCYFINYAGNAVYMTTQSSIFVESSHFSTIGYIEVARVIKTLTEASIMSNLADYKHFGLLNFSV